MTARNARTMAVLATIIAAAILTFATDAEACSVCFGDPESPMAKGAVWGVLVMVGFVGFVLSGIAGIAIFWMYRSRRFAQEAESLQLT